MRIFSVFFLLVGSGLILGSCAPRPVVESEPLPGVFPHHSLDDVQHFLGNATRVPAAYESRASMRLESPDQSGSFTAVLRQRNADSLYASMSPGLGIEAARMLVTQDSFFVHDRIRNRLHVGPVGHVSGALPFPAEIEEIVANIVGAVRPEPEGDWLLAHDARHYLIAAPDGRRVFAVDPATWRVTRYTETAEDGTLLEERIFSEFEIINGFFIPRRVVMRRPIDNLAINLYHRDIVINPARMDLRFSVDPSVPRVPF